jgi:hypothetical protein
LAQGSAACQQPKSNDPDWSHYGHSQLVRGAVFVPCSRQATTSKEAHNMPFSGAGSATLPSAEFIDEQALVATLNRLLKRWFQTREILSH